MQQGDGSYVVIIGTKICIENNVHGIGSPVKAGLTMYAEAGEQDGQAINQRMFEQSIQGTSLHQIFNSGFALHS